MGKRVGGSSVGAGCSGAAGASALMREGVGFTPPVGAAWVVVILIRNPCFGCARGLQTVGN